jgi:hypothetical protein
MSIPAIQLISYTSVFSKERAAANPAAVIPEGVYLQELALIAWN